MNIELQRRAKALDEADGGTLPLKTKLAPAVPLVGEEGPQEEIEDIGAEADIPGPGASGFAWGRTTSTGGRARGGSTRSTRWMAVWCAPASVAGRARVAAGGPPARRLRGAHASTRFAVAAIATHSAPTTKK